MLKENCTVTVTDFAVYPPPIVDFVRNVKRPFRLRFGMFLDELKHFDIKTMRKDLMFQPGKKPVIHTPKDSESPAQRPLALFSIIDSVEQDVKEITNIMETFVN